MTTLPAASAGAAAPTLPDSAPPLDAAPPHPLPNAHIGPAGAPNTAADLMARYGAEHDLHPLAQQPALYTKQADGTAGAQATKPQRGVPDAATRTWDVAKTSLADIDALKHSKDPQQQRLGHTIANAKAAHADLLAQGARIVVTMNEGNGKEPVMTLTAPGFDPGKPVRVHTHYHGDNATVGDPEGSKAGQASRIRATIARDPQMVFVLPECRNARPTPDSPKHNTGYPADWGNVKNQAQTTDIALQAAGIGKRKIEQETVSVHSRGGNVITNLMAKDGADGHKLRADRLELHDSLYGSQADVVRWGRTENGKQCEKVIYVRGTNAEGRDREIAKTFGGNYIRIDIAAQKPAHDQTPDGARAYHPDPHYQTTGRFVGIWPLSN